MPQGISVVIIDSDIDSINTMVRYMKSMDSKVIVEGTATTFENGFELVHKKRPMVVIIEVSEKIDLSLERISQILSRFSQVSIFATSLDKSSDTILKVMRAGATEYLLRPVTEADLTYALQKVGRLRLTRPAPEDEAGRIFTVFSPKGGVGVTTVAINLATDIFEATKKPTILVDLDLNSGDATTFLNMKPSYTISDVTVNISRLDKSFLQGVVAKHESGIYVLAEPQKVEEGVSIAGAEIKKVLSLLKSMFKYIIIDAETISERTTIALEMSDMILLVFFMSLPGIKNMQRYLRYFDKMGLGRDRVKLVANRYVKKSDIKIEDAEKALNYPIFWAVPNDWDTTMTCLNKGITISMGSPKSQLNVSLNELARAIISGRK
jgi:pilus assembly protein CpaE